MDFIKENKKIIIIIVISFFVGFFFGSSGTTSTTVTTQSESNSTAQQSSQTATQSTDEKQEIARTEIDLIPNEIITITKEQEGKYIIQEIPYEKYGMDVSNMALLSKNGETHFGTNITLKEGDQIMVSNCDATVPVRKLVPTK